jgi:flagellar biosynthesis/type III secretory pathway protein FliH
MINAVNQDFEEQSGHLADSEVARLLSVLQNAEFKRSDTRNVKKDDSFKPRTLMEIASEAQAREAQKKASQTKDNHTDDSPDLADAQLDEHKQVAQENTDIGGADASDLENLSPVQPSSDNFPPRARGEESILGEGEEDVTPKTNLETDESYANGQNLVADASQNLTAQDSQQAVKIEGGFETANEAFERGKAEGIVEGRQFAIAETEAAAKMAAKAELEDVVLAFAKAVDALAKPQAVQADTLAGSIHTAILKLASERAGQQIDSMPKAFTERINALVSSIGKKISEGQVQLNPDDYSLMAPYFADAALGFVANPDLMRGDVILKFDGVELIDIANNRIGSNYTSEAVRGDVAAPIEGDVIASGDAANTDPDGSGASLVDTDPLISANEEEHAPNLEDVNHDELGDHTRTAAEDADSADADASISEGLLPVQSSSVEIASPKLAEELSPSDSGTIVQTDRETLPNKPDEHDA